MCTVSFFPVKNGALITSNRDENRGRGQTMPPSLYKHGDQSLWYPKDMKGKGTWIGYNLHNVVAVLLNGAWIKHLPRPAYRQSRGLIIPSVLQGRDPFHCAAAYCYEDMEPFTLLLYKAGRLVEYRWDGTQLVQQNLDAQLPHIWNSVTLYAATELAQNKYELEQLYKLQADADALINFHHQKRYELIHPVASAANHICTVSVSQIAVSDGVVASFNYSALNTATINEHYFS